MADEDSNDMGGGFKSEDKPSVNYLFLIFLLLNSLLMVGIIYMQYTTHKKITERPDIRDVIKAEMKTVLDEKEVEDTGEAVNEDGLLFPLEGFTANLAQGDGPRRYVRLQAVLKFSKNSNETEFKARTPQIRDTIISILNSKRPIDLLKIEGKEYLKEEIKAAINSFLIDGSIVDIYYVSFQIN